MGEVSEEKLHRNAEIYHRRMSGEVQRLWARLMVCLRIGFIGS